MKKHVPVAFYSARSGVYYERRLRKSTQFVVGAYALVIGITVLLVSQGVRMNNHHAIAAKPATVTTLVAKTDTATPIASYKPKTPVAQTETDRLNTAVAAAIAQNPAAAWSVAVYDMQAKTWLLRSNALQQIDSASLYKLYVTYGLAEKIPAAQWSGIQLPGQTAGQNLQTCVDRMLRVSDNSCGEAVGAYVGWSAVDKYVHAAGFTGTTLNQKAGPVTTADDTTRFMAALYQGKLFDATTTAFVLNSLHNQLYRSAIPAGCPSCTTYNKTGLENDVAHDSAVVVSGGRTYAVTIMSQTSGSYAKISNIEHAIQSVLGPTTSPVTP